MKINLLDCTLRDGGYYNNWDFSHKLVNDYLSAMSTAGIKFVELGFRSLKDKDFKGPNWYTTDSYINNLNIPNNLVLGVMVNVFEIISHSGGVKKAIDKLFENKRKSKIKFIRLASHYGEFDTACKICQILKKKGYFVCINFMQASEYTDSQILKIAKKTKLANPDVLYFADSLGSMNSKHITKLVKNLRVEWRGKIGVHAHDNLSKAISNTITAIEAGVEWVDSTVTGMGRGPGNAQTEYLTLELNGRLNDSFKVLPITKLISEHFEKLKKIYNWGTNTYYYLAGINRIHPTYIQEMLYMKLDEWEILDAIHKLTKLGGNRYDVNLVKSEFQKPIKMKKGQWSPFSKIKSKEVLLLSSGSNLEEYKKEIEKYIINNKPVVIALNKFVKIKEKLIDMYITCNPLRLLADVDFNKKIKVPIILPKALLTKDTIKKLSKIKIYDYGVGIKENEFKIDKNYTLIPKLYTVAYALSVATSGKAKRILLAGFDGYGRDDKRTKAVDDLFFTYIQAKNSREIVAITPTTYSFKKMSIYALKKIEKAKN
jgi:4-hydroxy 2-oxovalerate aldolase